MLPSPQHHFISSHPQIAPDVDVVTFQGGRWRVGGGGLALPRVSSPKDLFSRNIFPLVGTFFPGNFPEIS